MDEVTAVN